MAIVRRDFPTASAPATVTDYQRQNTLLDKLMMKSQQIWHYGGAYYLPKGLIFYHGGTVYEVTANETISGVFSRYITVTKSVDGSTCTAAFVAVMTGITWNDSYNGYYDVSGNLVFVDEFALANAGTIAAPKGLLGWLGKIFKDMLTSATLSIGGALRLAGRLTVESLGFRVTGSSEINANVFQIKDLTGATAHFYLDTDISDTLSLSNLTLSLSSTTLQPTQLPTSGSQVIGAGADWTPARGVYVLSCPAAIRVKTSGSTSAADWTGGTLFTDGTKVKLTNTSLGAATVYWERF